MFPQKSLCGAHNAFPAQVVAVRGLDADVLQEFACRLFPTFIAGVVRRGLSCVDELISQGRCRQASAVRVDQQRGGDDPVALLACYKA